VKRRLATTGLVAVAVGVAVAGGWWLGSRPMVLPVSPGASVTRAVDSVPAGSVIRLAPGTYAPFTVEQGVTVEGVPGTVVRGPVTIRADGAALEGVRVDGGAIGISVQADGVRLQDVDVRGARLRGIEVVAGSASILDCSVGGLIRPDAQGIDVRNSDGHRRTLIQGCTVSSGQEGIVSHVSSVELRDNTIRGTTARAITVMEMSEGKVDHNTVAGAVGVGLYCGDMSRCDFRGNVVRGVTPDPTGVTTQAGFGAVATWYAMLHLSGNTFQVASPQPVGVFMESLVVPRSPLMMWPPGWRGALPVLWVGGLSLLGLALVSAAVYPVVRRRRGRRRGREEAWPAPPISKRAAWVLLIGFGVQSFHMLEHGVQVYQVYVAQSATRSGLLGAHFNTEWVHFWFNLAVLDFLIWATLLLWRSLGDRPAAVLLAALVIESWHMVEHSAKIVQFLERGAQPTPGLLGGIVGLVWFHFGINLAVYAGFTTALVAVARAGVLRPAWQPAPRLLVPA
jgi:hypothetical protein